VTVAALIIAAILAHKISYGVVILIAAVGGVWEFYTISAPLRGGSETSRKRARLVGVIVAFLAILLSWAFHFRYTESDLLVILPVVLFFHFVRGLFSKSDKPILDIAWDVFAVIYIILPVMLLNYLYFEKGELFALAILFLIWFYDSMCYITGSLIGRHKLIERVSPQKTIEGLAGGMILSLIFVFFFDKILALLVVKYKFTCWEYSHFQWLFIGMVTLIFATLGDLIESLLKRNIGIKDSGSILPGHGGFLDRLDAILVAIPFTVAAVFIVDRINDVYTLIDFLK
jgi:phosphatidate cytidylyltransferase